VTVLVLLDLCSVFDTINHETLLTRLPTVERMVLQELHCNASDLTSQVILR